MALYILRRLLLMVPTMFGITLLVFCVMQLAPGDPATLATAGDISSGGAATSGEGDVQSTYEKFRERFRLDEPLHVQYFVWVGNLLTFDFGVEFHDPSQSVGEELLRRLRITVPLALISSLLSYLIAIPLGVFSAVRRGSLADKLSTVVVFLLYSLPTFWVGLMLILAFGATGADLFPVIGLQDKDAADFSTWQKIVDIAWHCVLPVATMTYGGVAYLSRQMRAGMLETLRQDYVRTATAKGLSRRAVVYKHALRNSLIPVITIFATLLPILVGGSVLVESIFNIPGMGLYAFEGLLVRDYPVVMATVTFSAVMTLMGFLLSDVLYAVVDPRIKHD